MTEQSKIPLDKSRPANAGDSLFERASGAFGLSAMKPAAPPLDLSQARERVAPRRSQPQPIATQAEAAPVARAEVAPPQPAESAETERVALRGKAVSVDRKLLQETGMIVPDGPVTALLEEFRIVKRELLGDARETGTQAARRILVCSPHPNEGKTYCAVNLALAMAAERDIEVVLVDADFGNPSVPGVLGFKSDRGFMDTLSDPSIAPEDLVLSTDIEGLFVLPAGKRTTADAEYLASRRTSEVLDRLTAGAPNRILIFDTPPALAASPAADLAKHVGQALLVARADVTGQSALEDASQLLSACPDIKLLLNATQFSPSGRKFGSYGGYGN
ncbi:capsular biosynthesis protein [Altererythrobacter sp.]|uniref:capsular biosynthesis protein n=1 Tax=Altererythrobacter sp. TaxID=1872480 RepID=UPI003D02FD27